MGDAPENQAVEYEISKLPKYRPEDSKWMLRVGKGNDALPYT